MRVADYLKEIDNNFLPSNFMVDHNGKYMTMSRIAHPNIESLNIHIEKTPDQQFDFLIPTINLSLWHNIEMIKLFSNLKLLELDSKINQKILASL